MRTNEKVHPGLRPGKAGDTKRDNEVETIDWSVSLADSLPEPC
jgi:hypothetical protein